MKNLISLVVLSLLALAQPALAVDLKPINKENLKVEAPALLNSGGVDIHRTWTPPEICHVSKSLTCVVCAAGTAAAPSVGILVDIEVSSGAIGGFAVALDTGAIPSAGREPVGGAGGTAGSQIAFQRTAEYTLATTGLSVENAGRRHFDADGRPFSNGLTLCASTADTEVTATFRRLKQAK